MAFRFAVLCFTFLRQGYQRDRPLLSRELAAKERLKKMGLADTKVRGLKTADGGGKGSQSRYAAHLYPMRVHIEASRRCFWMSRRKVRRSWRAA